MKILLSWLLDHVPWTEGAAALAPLLTEAGFPVPSVEEIPASPGGSPDAVLDVEITSNRGDCMSHLGIAREVAAAAGLPLRVTAAPGLPGDGPEEASSLVSVEVQAGDLCPAYEARVLLDQRPGAFTPPALRRRLELLGQRPVNPVVDITNYLMLDRGQPLHAFDRSRLRGGRIVVRLSAKGEVIETLDGRRRILPEGLLVIADAERPVALAGLMGSIDTEVGPATREVVLESARFAPAAVRASAIALGLATEAGARFSRRVDPAEMGESSLRAAALLLAHAGGRLARGSVRAGPGAAGPPERSSVSLRPARLAAILGYSPGLAEVRTALERLSMSVREGDAGALLAVPPSWRGDVSIEEDLVEEVARVLGYDRIPVTLSLRVRPVPPRSGARAVTAALGALAAAGFREALTLPFTAPGPLDDPSPWTPLPALRVDNPTRSEEPLLRRSLLGPLLRCLERNRARGVAGARLFELGTVFLPREGNPRPEEHRLLSGVLEGDYRDARGAVEAVVEALGLEGRLDVEAAPADAPVRPLDVGRTARFLLGSETAGWAGEIRVSDLEGLGVHRECLRAAAFELDYDLLESAAVLDRASRPVSHHPLSTRDLAVLLPLEVRWAAVEQAVRSGGGPFLGEVTLFDDYRGKGVPEGFRSLAFHLSFGAPDQTLRGEEVDAAVASVVASLEAGTGGKLRS